MAEKSLEISLAGQDIRVGNTDNSTLSIKIENTVSQDTSQVLYLLLPHSLVAPEKTNDIKFSPAELAPTVEDGPKDATKFRLGTTRGVAFKAGQKILLELSDIAAVSVGPQTIEMLAGPRGGTQDKTDLKVDVLGADDVPKIIEFKAKDSVIVYRSSKDPVTLAWETSEGSDVELYRMDTKLLPLPGKTAPTKTDPYYLDSSYEGAGLQPYRLVVTADNKTISRTIFVRVQSPGWNRISCNQGAPISILNNNNEALYGIFNTDNGAAIYALDPTDGSMGTQTDICKNGHIPEGMETSPAALHSNKIFLVGGSQINASVFSNQVHVYDLKNGTWTDLSDGVKWSPRMGHALTVFDDKLWMTGGVDANGNTLTEVYCSKDGTSWTLNETPLTKGISLHSSIAYQPDRNDPSTARLWIYGGVASPHGEPRTSLWSADKTGVWTEQKFEQGSGKDPSPNPGLGGPFGAALAVGPGEEITDRLWIIGTYQHSNASIQSGMNYLQRTDPNDPSNLVPDGHPLSSDVRWRYVENSNDAIQPFKLNATQFKNYIFVQSLLSDFSTNTLSYYVQ